jgi:hypothetical protein
MTQPETSWVSLNFFRKEGVGEQPLWAGLSKIEGNASITSCKTEEKTRNGI